MRISRLNETDLVAGLLVAAAATVYAAGEAGANLPGLGGMRARACTVFVFGILACATGARRDAFGDGSSGGPFVAILNAIGVMTFIVGMTAIILGSAPYLTALMVGVGLLWIGATVRHLRTPSPSTLDQIPHRELVKR